MSADQDIIIPDPAPAFEWTHTIKRPDGLIVSTTVTVPPSHPAVQPKPTRWNEKGDWTLKEMGELTYMANNSAHSVIENNWSRRGYYEQQDHYWGMNLDKPTHAIEPKKEG